MQGSVPVASVVEDRKTLLNGWFELAQCGGRGRGLVLGTTDVGMDTARRLPIARLPMEEDTMATDADVPLDFEQRLLKKSGFQDDCGTSQTVVGELRFRAPRRSGHPERSVARTSHKTCIVYEGNH